MKRSSFRSTGRVPRRQAETTTRPYTKPVGPSSGSSSSSSSPPSSLPACISWKMRRFSSTLRLRHALSMPSMRSCTKSQKKCTETITNCSSTPQHIWTPQPAHPPLTQFCHDSAAALGMLGAALHTRCQPASSAAHVCPHKHHTVSRGIAVHLLQDTFHEDFPLRSLITSAQRRREYRCGARFT